MEAVALVSGGKDSCFSILKAKAFGVRVVVLAHIEPFCDEPDSMMYQSVGSAAVPQIAQSLGLPLIVRKTQAVAKSTGLTYRPTDGDEVEDLVALLAEVCNQFPNVKAVTSGALWSDYQRLRVESAAFRTGLLSISPLWRREQSQLLDEMIASGLDAVLVKVAGVGLNGSHLGRSIKEMRPHLHKLERLYGSHVCGEGGEYETIVRWMPGFKYRLEFTSMETVIHSDDQVAPVSYLRLKTIGASTVDSSITGGFLPVVANRPAVFNFEPKFYESLSNNSGELKSNTPSTTNPKSIGEVSQFLHLVLFSKDGSPKGVYDVCAQLSEILQDRSEPLSSVVSIQLYLENVHGNSYVEANQAYKETFSTSQTVVPPVRACVGVAEGNCGTTMEVLVRKGSREGATALHVQSLSEWAPPCIGPYAQFVEEDEVVHVSGALPLFPATASVPKGMPVSNQVSACFENISKTLEAGRTKIENMRLFILYVTPGMFSEEVEQCLMHMPSTDNNIKVIVPVGTLPKEALIEIKAFGVLSDSSPSNRIAKRERSTLQVESILCGKFNFIVLQSWDDENRIEGSITTTTNTLDPLAIQIFCHKSLELDKDIGSLRAKMPDTSILRLTSEWMPSQTRWIAILTLLHRH